MISTVAVVTSLYGVYRQLRMQSAQGAWEQLESISEAWASERLDRAKLAVLIAVRDTKDLAAIPSSHALIIAAYWERLGALVKLGHVDAKLLYSFNGGACPLWWAALAPLVRRLRTEWGDPAEFEAFETLAARMTEFDRRGGASLFDEALLREQLDDRIATYEERLRANAA
jgi:hypothetical protein